MPADILIPPNVEIPETLNEVTEAIPPITSVAVVAVPTRSP